MCMGEGRDEGLIPFTRSRIFSDFLKKSIPMPLKRMFFVILAIESFEDMWSTNESYSPALLIYVEEDKLRKREKKRSK